MVIAETSFLTKTDSQLNNDIYISSFSDNILINFRFNFALKVTSVYLLGKVQSKLLLDSVASDTVKFFHLDNQTR